MQNKITHNTQVRYLKGVGPKSTKRLNKLGIKTIRDLIYYFPRDWKDFSHPRAIKGLRINEEAIIKARIVTIETIKTFRKKMFLTKALLLDDMGDEILSVWFNQPYIENYLKKDSVWLFSGKVGYDFSDRKKSLNNPECTKKSQIIPVYSETEGISSHFLAKCIKIALSKVSLRDFLPPKILKKENLIELHHALNQIHFPSNLATLHRAKERLAFDEFFLLSLQMLKKRRKFKSLSSPELKVNKTKLEKFRKSLPFTLTSAQSKAIYEILTDLSRPSPMTRLLNGDVGSGKTIVAAFGVLSSFFNGYQTVWMAPTSILANQHYKNISQYFKDIDIKVSLLTSNQLRIKNKNKDLKLKKSQLKTLTQTSDLIIGTHALIQKGIKFDNLGLVIVDEEHRFGVKQRAKLVARGLTQTKTQTNAEKNSQRKSELSRRKSAKVVPHFLSMTATPIPRTLAISIYADLDISVLDEFPPQRKPVVTRLVSSINRSKAYHFIHSNIKKGRQAFVVCPLIEENSKFETQNSCLAGRQAKQIPNSNFQNKLLDIERKSVKKEYDKLSRQIFPDLRISMLHGKMKPKEKEKIMSRFSSGKIDILVSTSVVEVGVDVPNATFMIIEDAERFGLAQLHQFRGRVGRGKEQSFCLLFSSNISQESKRRLQAMEKYSDGFKLAQIDLVTRGPGEFSGKRQSGFRELKIASLSDTITLKKARLCAKYILDQGLDNFPKLKKITGSK